MKDLHKLYANKKTPPSFAFLSSTIKACLCTRHHKSQNRNAYLPDTAEKETTLLCVKQTVLKMNYMANVMLN